MIVLWLQLSRFVGFSKQLFNHQAGDKLLPLGRCSARFVQRVARGESVLSIGKHQRNVIVVRLGNMWQGWRSRTANRSTSGENLVSKKSTTGFFG
jgi:hypothetical protein